MRRLLDDNLEPPVIDTLVLYQTKFRKSDLILQYNFQGQLQFEQKAEPGWDELERNQPDCPSATKKDNNL